MLRATAPWTLPEDGQVHIHCYCFEDHFPFLLLFPWTQMWIVIVLKRHIYEVFASINKSMVMFLTSSYLTFTPTIGKIVILKSNLLHFFSSPGAMLFIRAETFKAGYSAYSLQLYPVLSTVGWTGLQHWPQQCELLSVCGAMHQDPAGRGQEQEKKSEWALRANAVRGSHTRSFKPNKYILNYI